MNDRKQTTPTLDFGYLRQEYPACVPRLEIKRATRGVYDPRYISNLDSQGKGPSGRMRIGGRIVYRTEDFIRFLEERTEPLDKEDPEAA